MMIKAEPYKVGGCGFRAVAAEVGKLASPWLPDFQEVIAETAASLTGQQHFLLD